MKPSHHFGEAHAICTALMTAFVSNLGGKSDPDALARVASLCEAALSAVDDPECRVALRGVQAYATLLYSDDGHEGAQCGSLHGIDAIRFQTLNALSAFRDRLTLLDCIPPSVPELPALEAKKRQRIVVVDDNRDSAESLRKLLELCGYTVMVAYCGRDALEAVRRTRPHVVLCDIGLPDIDGFTVAREIQKDPAAAGVRLIAVTAYNDDHHRTRSRECGFELHLVKPVDPEILLQKLAQAAWHNRSL